MIRNNTYEEYIAPYAESLDTLKSISLLLNLSLYSEEEIDFDIYEDYGEL